MGRKKQEQPAVEETTVDVNNLEEITAEEIVEQYKEEQPEAQDEGENLETVEENKEEEA